MKKWMTIGLIAMMVMTGGVVAWKHVNAEEPTHHNLDSALAFFNGDTHHYKKTDLKEFSITTNDVTLTGYAVKTEHGIQVAIENHTNQKEWEWNWLKDRPDLQKTVKPLFEDN